MELDSISDYDDTIDGDDDRVNGYLPEGVRLKFGNIQRWENTDGTVLDGMILVHLDTQRTEVTWGKNKRPVGPPRILGPGEKFRDEQALNENIPKSEWLPGFKEGTLRGPVQNQNVCIFGDIATMGRYVWPSPLTTVGSAIAVRQLNDAVRRMRQFRGARVFAKVRLAKTDFPNNWGKRIGRIWRSLVG